MRACFNGRGTPVPCRTSQRGGRTRVFSQELTAWNTFSSYTHGMDARTDPRSGQPPGERQVMYADSFFFLSTVAALWQRDIRKGRAGVRAQAMPRKVDVRLPGKGKSNSHGARPVHLIITLKKWIRTNRLSITSSLCTLAERHPQGAGGGASFFFWITLKPTVE